VTGSPFICSAALPQIVAELSALSPTNPFATEGYFAAMRAVGRAPWVLGLASNGALEVGCGAFLKAGRLGHHLEIPSLPAVAQHSPFWSGLREFCRQHGVVTLELGTFASPAGVAIPTFGVHFTRRPRCEYLMELGENFAARLVTNHRRNLRRAQQAGLVISRTRSAQGLRAHQELRQQSLARRRSRGEDIGQLQHSSEEQAFLQSGVGELFQALQGTSVVSSVLVLQASLGGYYQSAGTSSAGMALGASHFLIHGIAQQLQANGAQMFNLGGADSESTLGRFKAGFGATRVACEAASCYVGPRWTRAVRRGVHLLRKNPAELVGLFSARMSRWIVYAIDTEGLAAPVPRAGLEFTALLSDDLHALPADDASFRSRQLERLQRFGASYAYAVTVNGQLAHISWLLPAQAMGRDHPQVFRPLVDEAEITACETLPPYRGRGIYPFAVRNLLEVARRNGIRRILMKTRADNLASRAGIEKAGLQRLGSALLIATPILDRPVIWRRFR